MVRDCQEWKKITLEAKCFRRRSACKNKTNQHIHINLFNTNNLSREFLAFCSYNWGCHYSGIRHHGIGSLVQDILGQHWGLIFKGQMSNRNSTTEDEQKFTFSPWKLDYYAVSQHWTPITQWQSPISQKDRDSNCIISLPPFWRWLNIHINHNANLPKILFSSAIVWHS